MRIPFELRLIQPFFSIAEYGVVQFIMTEVEKARKIFSEQWKKSGKDENVHRKKKKVKSFHVCYNNLEPMAVWRQKHYGCTYSELHWAFEIIA